LTSVKQGKASILNPWQKAFIVCGLKMICGPAASNSSKNKIALVREER
jgi:hypothetical protein